MSKATTQDRLAVKTPESAFVHVLQEEFDFSLRVSRELLSTAKEMLVGGVPSAAVRPGQVRLVVASAGILFLCCYSNSRFVAAISKSRLFSHVKHPARLRNRGYDLTFHP